MLHLTDLERDAIGRIVAEAPEYRVMLDHQLQSVMVEKRENTGGGFLTTLLVAEATTIEIPSPLGLNVYGSIDGMAYGLGFLLFIENGLISLLEGYSVGGEDTADLDFERVAYTITSKPVPRPEIVR